VIASHQEVFETLGRLTRAISSVMSAR